MKQFGYPSAKWSAAKAEMTQLLARIAARGQLISYSELASSVRSIEFDPRSPALAEMLGDVSRAENAAGRGMLSVVVVHRDGDQMPGDGFFSLARSLGRSVQDRDACWIAEVKRVHEAYRLLFPAEDSEPAPLGRSAQGKFELETDLHALGYQISGLTREARWHLLAKRAVPELGLRSVANTIAGLVRVRKLQRLGAFDYQNAIDEWEHDLKRLRDEFYGGEFPWPTTEP